MSTSRTSPRKLINWAKQSLYGSMVQTRLFLRRQLWVWPVVAFLFLLTIGLFVRHAVESTMRANLQAELLTVLNVEVAMIKNWLATQQANASSLANDRDVRQFVNGLVEQHRSGKTDAADVPLTDLLHRELAPGVEHHNYLGFLLFDKSRTILAASTTALIGQKMTPMYDDLLRRVFQGESVVTPPFESVTMLEDRTGRVRTDVPTMFVCAPVRDDNLQVVGALCLRLDPDQKFSEMLQLGRMGETGETYAFDRRGLFVSRSRFEEELILLGLLPDQADISSTLKLELRDPGGDLTQGFRPGVRRGQLQFTKSAASALSGQNGYDVLGYRDYRGVTVVGAWKWLPEHQLGIATEMDVAEAYRPLYILRRTVWSMFALLGVAAVAIFVFTILVARANRAAQLAAIEAKQLGQYQLDEKLGAGAMGIVYRGHHAMLRRPTAIKLLNVDRTNEASIQRFEREVQLTCQLNHPNTVMIYDFGRTPEGVFYYAMEYLHGIDLEALVERYGPQPEGRVIRILHQVCGSLYEAHLTGLVHRDIKPANIMLNRWGGEPDFVKVLDFGLAKAVDQQKQAGLTQANALTGTPLYLSPEAIQSPDSVDARSDLYALGAVGYFLLTGQPVFQGETLLELCQKHVSAPPIPPSERLGRPISTELEHAILSCLEKSPARRPQTARELAQRLERCPAWSSWTVDRADAWWRQHERQGGSPGSSQSIAHDRTIIGSGVDTQPLDFDAPDNLDDSRA